jgi:ribosomal protein S18 acetylase RimI-like enzyme
VAVMACRQGQPTDLPFLRRMLYEAIFWRSMHTTAPSFEDAMARPDVALALADWGERAGDTAFVATIDGVQAGVAWYRTWNDAQNINGYITATMPVVVIGVARDFRRGGVGACLMSSLMDAAAAQGVPALSLSVTKDNHALKLYRCQGFVEHTDRGDGFLMVRHIT